MHDLLAPIVAVILAAVALLVSAIFGYRIGRAAARSRSRRILAEAVALRGSAGRELLAALNHRAAVEATMGVAYVAGWRPARAAVAVEVVSAPGAPREARDTPVSGQHDTPVGEPPDMADPFAELDEPDSHVRRTMPPPPMAQPVGVSPLAESVRRPVPPYEGVTPRSPKEPKS